MKSRTVIVWLLVGLVLLWAFSMYVGLRELVTAMGYGL